MSKNKHLYAVILAGGSGTRFWPLSRAKKPKQFLKILGKNSLLQDTIARITPLIAPAHIFIVSNKIHIKELKSQIKPFRIPSKNILLEPQARNTAPAICWAASQIHKMDPQATLAVLPSDHLILNKAAFLQSLREAVDLAQKDCLVTFGITPTR